MKLDERIVIENEYFVPWFLLGNLAYETMIVSKRNVNKITDFTEAEVADLLLF
jgi:UDPglucose--hexose-1-phosphate uridylyltransferase